MFEIDEAEMSGEDELHDEEDVEADLSEFEDFIDDGDIVEAAAEDVVELENVQSNRIETLPPSQEPRSNRHSRLKRKSESEQNQEQDEVLKRNKPNEDDLESFLNDSELEQAVETRRLREKSRNRTLQSVLVPEPNASQDIDEVFDVAICTEPETEVWRRALRQRHTNQVPISALQTNKTDRGSEASVTMPASAASNNFNVVGTSAPVRGVPDPYEANEFDEADGRSRHLDMIGCSETIESVPLPEGLYGAFDKDGLHAEIEQAWSAVFRDDPDRPVFEKALRLFNIELSDLSVTNIKRLYEGYLRRQAEVFNLYAKLDLSDRWKDPQDIWVRRVKQLFEFMYYGYQSIYSTMRIQNIISDGPESKSIRFSDPTDIMSFQVWRGFFCFDFFYKLSPQNRQLIGATCRAPPSCFYTFNSRHLDPAFDISRAMYTKPVSSNSSATCLSTHTRGSVSKRSNNLYTTALTSTRRSRCTPTLLPEEELPRRSPKPFQT